MSAEQRRWLAGLYEANFAAVFRRCGVLLKSAEDAADAAHEVFLIAVNSLAPKTEEKRARAWLLTVAHNHCLDILRRRKRFGRALVVLGANEAGDDLEAGVVDRDFVDQVLRQLSARERLALWQSAVERRSLADLAPGSVAGLLAPLTGGDRPGDTSIFSAPAAIPPMASSTVKTLTDRIQQSIGRLVPSAAITGGPIASPTGSGTVPVIPGVPAVPSVPPAPSVPPGPSLPPPGP